MIILILFMHFVADFLLQSDWMAINKSKQWHALLIHVCIYSVSFSWLGWKFMAFNFVAHFITDAITSRITAKLWASNQRHWFFCMIGFDQFIHAATLIGSYGFFAIQ